MGKKGRRPGRRWARQPGRIRKELLVEVKEAEREQHDARRKRGSARNSKGRRTQEGRTQKRKQRVSEAGREGGMVWGKALFYSCGDDLCVCGVALRGQIRPLQGLKQ